MTARRVCLVAWALARFLALLPWAACSDGPAATPPDAPAIFDGPAPDGATAPDPAVGSWRPGFSLPGPSGMGARVETLVAGADGSVIIAGIFDEIAGTPARNVARWDGARWHALGEGLPGWVKAMAVDAEGRVWAASTDDVASVSSSRLARWDGAAWTAMPGAIDGQVEDLIAARGEILVVGGFQHAGAAASPGLARFAGGDWHAIGAGAPGASAILATSAGYCIAGTFEEVGGVAVENAACWDGTAWSPLGTGLPGNTDVLTIGLDGRFYAGGRLTFAHTPSPGQFRFGLAVLDDGAWVPFAGGVDGGFITDVRAIAWLGDSMYIGGDFQVAGAEAPVAASRIARHDASGWHPVGDGLHNGVGLYLGDVPGANDLLVVGAELWIGGTFSSTGGPAATNLARIDASGAPRPVLPAGATPRGLSGFTEALTIDGEGRLVAGGRFSDAGDTRARNVARLGDAGWEALGDGFNDVVLVLLARRDGTLVAGGSFTRSGTAEVPFLAVWGAKGWSPLGPPPDGPVRALAEDDAGHLYVGGAFEHIGGVAAAHVARFDGAAWTALGAGLDDTVAALAWTGTELVAGGAFQASGSAEVLAVARWDGVAWHGLGGGLDDRGRVSDLAVTPAGLVIAGQFEVVGASGVADLARWDGVAWHGFGSGLDDDAGLSEVTVVLPLGDGLFAGGTFDRSGNAAVRHLAWWDGAAWHDLGGGLDDLPSALAAHGTTLWVGGPAIEVGGRVSSGIAAWDF